MSWGLIRALLGFLSFCVLLFGFALGQNCQDAQKYHAAMDKAAQHIADGRYEEAQKLYDVALIYCRKELSAINAAKQNLFDKINQLRITADSTALAALGSNLAYKSRAALAAGSREVAFQIARIGLAFSQPDHPELFGALFAALHYNSLNGVEVKVPRSTRLMGHSAPLFSGEFSPDGKLILTSALDGACNVWEASSGKLLKSLPNMLAGPCIAIFSKSGDHVALGSMGKPISLVDWKTGKVIWTGSEATRGTICLAFSESGQKLMAGNFKGNFSILETATGKELWSDPATLGLRKLVMNGQEVVCIYDDGKIKLHDQQGKFLREYEGGWDLLKGGIGAMAKQNMLAFGSHLGEIKTYALKDGKEIGAFGAGIADLEQLAIAPDGKHLAVAAKDMSIQIYELPYGRLVARCNGHSRRISSLVFSPDGSRLLSSGQDQTACIWHWQKELEAPIGKLVGEIAPSLNLEAKGRLIETDIADGKRLIKLLGAGTVIHTMEAGEGATYEMQSSQDGRFCAVFNASHAEIMDTKDWKSLGKLEVLGSSKRNLAFSANAKEVWILAKDRTLKGYACKDLSLLHSLPLEVEQTAFEILHVPVGEKLALAAGKEVKIYNVQSKALETSIPLPLYLEACVFGFSPDGQYLAIGTWSSTLEIWDLAANKMRWRSDVFGEAVTSLQFSPNGRYLLAGMRSGLLQILDFKRQVTMLSLQLPDEISDIGFNASASQVFAVYVTGYSAFSWQPAELLAEWTKASSESFLTYQQLQQYEIVNALNGRDLDLEKIKAAFGPWQMKAFADWLGYPLVLSQEVEAVQRSFLFSNDLYDHVLLQLDSPNIVQDQLNMLARWRTYMEGSSELKAPFDLEAKMASLKSRLNAH